MISFRGRRSHWDFSLSSRDYGVFGAFKYEANMLLCFIGPEVLAGFLVLLRNRFLFGLFNGSAKPHNIFFSYLTKIENTEFLSLITCKFSADLLDF